MALQGTLDTFALPDVLRLLASTKKVGRLRVSGDAGSGSLWVDAGVVVGGELLVRDAQADSLSDVLFHLLRFPNGSFTFEAGSAPPATGPQRDVEGLIVEAERMLGEWVALTEVVPSLDAWLSLRPELRGRDVVIDSARWQIIVTVGSGATVGDVARRTGLADLAVMRAVKEVVELGLVEVTSGSAGSDAATWAPLPAATTIAPSVTAAPVAAAPVAATPTDVTADPFDRSTLVPFDPPEVVAERVPFADAPFADAFSAYDAADATALHEFPDPVALGPLGYDPSTEADAPVFADDTPLAPPSISEMRSGLGAMQLSDEPARRPSAFDAPLDDPAEIARQLANLSPRAAKAVAAAAKATTDEEREAALAAIEAEDETINRGLLLKFLGAVDS